MRQLALSVCLLAASAISVSTAQAHGPGKCEGAFSKLEAIIKPSAFKEYDIRGVAGVDLSPAFAHKLGRAYATYLHSVTKKPAAGRARLTIAVGYDARLSSPSYRAALIEGLLESGIDVIDIGLVSTPLTYFSSRSLDLDGSIMVTASHNPGKYNGFKISVGTEPIFGDKIRNLRNVMEADTGRNAETRGTVAKKSIIASYHRFVLENLRRLNLSIDPAIVDSIVVDNTNGVAGGIAPSLYRQLGVKVVSLFEKPDGHFPNHNPDPSVAANIKTIQAEVVKSGAKLGIAFDGDADRIVLIDEKGTAVSGDVTMALLAKDVLDSHPGATIMGEVKMGSVFYDTITNNGGKAIMFRTGAALMKDKIDELGIALAGESSGHIIYGKKAGWINTDDAIYVGARVMAIITKENKPLSEILAPYLHTSVSTPESRLEVDDEVKFKLVELLKKDLLADGLNVNSIDGVRVTLANGSWGLIRASNTEPALSVRFEARTAADLHAVEKMMFDRLSAAAHSIGYSKPIKESAGH